MENKNNTLILLQQSLNVAGLATHLAEPTEAVPVYQLRVLLESKVAGEEVVCEIMLLPELPEPAVLQLFVPFPFFVEFERIGELARFLHMVNNAMPLHGFGMMESSREVYFRQLLPFRQDALDHQLVIESFFVFDASIGLFVETIRQLAVSEITFDQATEELQRLLHQLNARTD
ncbi:MAG: hypothetical protein AAFZ15_23525 [Bacteroidota bacterium]